MRSSDAASRFLVQLALCLFALGAGIAAARYTDIARHDRTRADPSSALAPPQDLRASVR